MRDDSVMVLEYRRARSDEPPASTLLRELNDLLDAQYPGRAARPGSVTTPDEMVPPDGVFLVGYDAGRPIAIGGIRRLQDGICELKRMYVVPDARSAGAGRALLVALEDAARGLGYSRVRLDAGPRQGHSRTLFRKTGYVEIGKYNDNHIATYFAEKRL
jgi:GNAT superfamily N-acetyltransferase